MASIKTVFTLTDNVSPALKTISINASLTQKSLTGLSGALNNVGTTGNIGDSASVSVDKMTDSAKLADKSFNNLVRTLVGVSSTIAIVSNAINILSRNLGRVNALIKEYEDAISAETRLITVMKQRMNATEDMIDSVRTLSSELQNSGIYSADLLMYGAQELATYVDTTDALNKLIPAMADLVAQRAGYTATSNDIISASTMIGKVMIGQANAMTRVGYYFSEAEQKIIKYGTEAQKVAVITDVITRNVGAMNTALAQTEIGSIMQLSNQINDIRENVGGAFVGIKREFLQFKLLVYQNLQEPIVNAVKVIRANLRQILTTTAVVASGVAVYGALMATGWALANIPIVAVIGSLILVSKVLGELGLYTGTTFEFMSGLVGAFVGFVVSGFNVIYNAVASVWNVVASLVETMANMGRLLDHPIRQIQTIFINLALSIQGVLMTIASAIDAVFGSNLAGAIESEMKALEAYKTSLWADLEGTDAEYKVAKKLELKTTQETSMPVYSAKAINGATSFTEWVDSVFTNTDKNWDNLLGGKSTISVSDASTVMLVDEVKDLLARRALDKYIVQISQVTPQLDIAKIEVRETADADKVISMIADGYEKMVTSYLGD